MNPDTYGLEVTFELEHAWNQAHLLRVLGEIMATVGFFSSGNSLKRDRVERGEWLRDRWEVLAAQPLPVLAFGDAFKQTKQWQANHNCGGTGVPNEELPRQWVQSYAAELEEVGIFKAFKGERNDDNGFWLNTWQKWVFDREKSPGQDHLGTLRFYTGVLPAMFRLREGGNCEYCKGLDRFWTLAFQDVVMQVHRRLGSRKTVVWQATDEDVREQKWLELKCPSRMYFWDLGLYQATPLGMPEIDAALDFYEQDLRNDPLREGPVSFFDPLPFDGAAKSKL